MEECQLNSFTLFKYNCLLTEYGGKSKQTNKWTNRDIHMERKCPLCELRANKTGIQRNIHRERVKRP